MTALNWYDKNPRRLKNEIIEVEEHYPNFELCMDENQNLYWKGSLKYNSEEYNVKILYLSSFPCIRPLVFFMTEDYTILENFQSSHQNKDGSICLYTYDNGPEGWKLKYTARDIIEKLLQLLKLRGDKEIEELHTSFFKRYFGHKIKNYIFIIPKEFQDFISRNKYGTFVSLGNHLESKLRLVVVVNKGKEHKTINEEGNPWRSIPPVRETNLKGFWYFLKRKPISWYNIKKNKTILNLIKQNQYNLPNIEEPFPLILFYKIRKSFFATAFWMKLNDNEYLNEKPGYFDVDIVNLNEEIFKRNKEKIGKGLDILKEKRVIAIGLGSVGSSVVMELAKSGVGNFVLYDPDILEFSNITKHVGNLSTVFRPKSNIMEDMIRKINPNANIENRAASPLDEKHTSEFIEILESNKENSILIVTTAEHEIEAMINEYSINLGLPAIYGSALDNADYGRIFRVIPGITPCYECVSILNEIYPEVYPSIVDEETTGSLGEFEAYRHPGFPGISIDVGFISLLISRIALQTLLRETEGSTLYPDSDNNHILWSNRAGWVFSEPLQIRYIDYPKVENCPICGEKSEIAPLTNEEIREHEDVISNIKRDDLSDKE